MQEFPELESVLVDVRYALSNLARELLVVRAGRLDRVQRAHDALQRAEKALETRKAAATCKAIEQTATPQAPRG